MATVSLSVSSSDSEIVRVPTWWEKNKKYVPVWIFFGAWVVIFAVLLTQSLKQARAASTRAISMESPQYTGANWYIFTVKYPKANFFPKSLGAVGSPNNATSNRLAIELSFNSIEPSLSGCSLSYSVHAYLTDTWLNQETYPPYPNYSVLFAFNNDRAYLSTDSLITDFLVARSTSCTTGSVMQYPFDKYSVNFYLSSVLTDIDDSKYLISYMLHIDDTDIGVFEHTSEFFAATNRTGPYVKVTFNRPWIVVLYPMVIIISFSFVMFGVVTFILPQYLSLKKTDNPGQISAMSSLFFALPAVRGTLTSNPPIGCVMDFASFYWSEVLAVVAYFYAAGKWYKESIPKVVIQTVEDKK